MGPTLRSGPRRRWNSLLKAPANSGGNAKSKDEAPPVPEAAERPLQLIADFEILVIQRQLRHCVLTFQDSFPTAEA